ncbi:Hypothetical protein CCH01_019910 [Clostridium chauvoei JF4335]|nr:Hypothetical protein CCH01_019910 [Clostridium chauvoei JF4335]
MQYCLSRGLKEEFAANGVTKILSSGNPLKNLKISLLEYSETVMIPLV